MWVRIGLWVWRILWLSSEWHVWHLRSAHQQTFPMHTAMMNLLVKRMVGFVSSVVGFFVFVGCIVLVGYTAVSKGIAVAGMGTAAVGSLAFACQE